MNDPSKLGKVDCFAGNQFIHSELSCFRRTKNRVVIGVDRLWNTETHTALAHGIEVKEVCDIISVINTQLSSWCRRILISTLSPITM